MEDEVVITFTGLSKWATLNGTWALMEKGVRPKRVYVFHQSPISDLARESRDMLEKLVCSTGDCVVMDISVPYTDIQEFKHRLDEVVRRERRLGARIHIDITPGRKLFAVSAMTIPSVDMVESLSYLYIDNLSGANRPYPMIPFKRQRLMELEVPR